MQLPHKGKEDKAALDELRSLVQPSVRSVLLGFAGKWFDSANALAEHVGLVPLAFYKGVSVARLGVVDRWDWAPSGLG